MQIPVRKSNPKRLFLPAEDVEFVPSGQSIVSFNGKTFTRITYYNLVDRTSVPLVAFSRKKSINRRSQEKE
jgi:hypothetical protein